MTEVRFKEKLKEAVPEMPESFHVAIEDKMVFFVLVTKHNYYDLKYSSVS